MISHVARYLCLKARVESRAFHEDTFISSQTHEIRDNTTHAAGTISILTFLPLKEARAKPEATWGFSVSRLVPADCGIVSVRHAPRVVSHGDIVEGTNKLSRVYLREKPRHNA